MATSWTDVANAALTKVGAAQIVAISDVEDITEEARLVRSRYEYARDYVLRGHTWSCASKRIQLAPLASAPAFEFAYQFQLPSDFLRINYFSPEPCRYRREGNRILADENLLNLVYVYRVKDPVELDQLCVDAIASYLAYDISEKLRQDPATRQTLLQEYKDILARASAIEGYEQSGEQMDNTYYLDAKLRYGSSRIARANYVAEDL